MSKIPPTKTRATRPGSYEYDSSLSLADNAKAAWEHHVEVLKLERTARARRLAKQVLHLDDIQVEFRPYVLDGQWPVFQAEDELVALALNAQGTETLALIELCSKCGENPNGTVFPTLEDYGRVLGDVEGREYQCGECRQAAELVRAGA